MKAQVLLLALSLLGSAVAMADEIRMAASDLLAEFINPELKAFAEERNVNLTVESIGSLPALDRLRSDEIDLAIIAVPEGAEIPRDQYSIYPFCYDTAIVVVNATNPIDEISISRLGGIFGANEEFNFNTWGELGLSSWGSRDIKPMVGIAEGSISLELFRYTIFTGGALKPSVTVLRETEIEEAVAGNITSIAILSSLPKDSDLKVLMISEQEGVDSPAFGPSADNIHLRDYPLRLSFYIAFNPRDQDKVKKLLRFLLGSEIAEALNKNQLVALPDAVRDQLVLDLNFEE